MKITDLELIHVRPRWLILKIHTDAGIVGLGEPTLEGRAQTVETAVRETGRMLIGEDPRRIEHLFQRMYRQTFYRGGPVLSSAISGIEQAMWDILGKSLGVPVWQLLGGRVRDRIRLYGRLPRWTPGSSFDEFHQALRDPQFTAYKGSLNVPARHVESPQFMQDYEDYLAAAREALGPKIDIAIDLHGRVSPAVARRLLRRFEPYEPLFVEEPVLPGDTAALLELTRSTSVPIATGERLFLRWQFQEVIESQAVAVLQPDLSHCGGLFEARKVAAMAEARNIAVAPHCPLGPVSLAACLQLAACTHNFLCQEHVTTGEGYLTQPFVITDGYVDVPQGPGLGIELDDEAIEEKRFAGDWDTPTLAHEDGAVAEW